MAEPVPSSAREEPAGTGILLAVAAALAAAGAALVVAVGWGGSALLV